MAWNSGAQVQFSAPAAVNCSHTGAGCCVDHAPKIRPHPTIGIDNFAASQRAGLRFIRGAGLFRDVLPIRRRNGDHGDDDVRSGRNRRGTTPVMPQPGCSAAASAWPSVSPFSNSNRPFAAWHELRVWVLLGFFVRVAWGIVTGIDSPSGQPEYWPEQPDCGASTILRRHEPRHRPAIHDDGFLITLHD